MAVPRHAGPSGGPAPLVIVLLGGPGAGKGTQAPILAERLGIPILASGDLLRAVASTPTELGREVDRIMQSGALVPDATIVRIFLERLDAPDAVRGAILDGFPRTAAQAQVLDEALAARGTRVSVAILIDVPVSELVGRMTDRVVCRAAGHPYNLQTAPPAVAGICDLDGSELFRRADDDEATVRARLAQQLEPLKEVIEHYRPSVLRTVDGRQPIEAVTTSVMAALPEPQPAAAPGGSPR
ncbi:MAG TPA: nucleoside monophosphate kinase [Candidatus Limnocylindrales bacterium]|nr:nucleoside monophosphate kinase [Candidatus Limnocylindrales bacterium]